MNRPLIIILILAFLALLFLGASYISKTLCGTGVAAAAAAPSNNGIWAFDDGNNFKAESNQYYRFKRNSINNIPGNTESFRSTIGNTVGYLKKNGARMLTVTGLYSESEKYSGNAGNLGFARANDIKKALIADGVPSNQIDTESRVLREDLFRSDTLQRGACFTFYPKNGKANAVAQSSTSFIAGKATAASTAVSAGKKLIGKSMVIYFGTNQSQLNLSANQKQDMADIKAYLAATPGASLEVSGHTDKIGNASYNKSLSRKRARFAAGQLSDRFGISTSRMKVRGYGEERPIDNSNTQAGLAKNRRVEVTLKEN